MRFPLSCAPRLPLFALLAGTLPAHPEPTDRVDFQSHIAPIFQAHCVSCHGPEKQKSGYRLDQRDWALKGGESGNAAILPGNATKSPLLHFVGSADSDTPMPPKKSDQKPLSKAQVALLQRWIDQGAPWSEGTTSSPLPSKENPLDWWSLRPLQRPGIPPTPHSHHPIDAFILAKLQEKNLTPSPPADRATLLQRLSFDLTGLPPSPEELTAFLADSSPQAYENVVDRLLASPRYGERWARHWLDVVHYGDTHGYDKDQPRPNAWPYRDYVIRALNEDKPYAHFIQEQLAGDILFPGSRDGMQALGFLAAGPWDAIGHLEVSEEKIDGKIARHLDRDDMVSNTIGTFCSTTIHCAQCHNHKFDPFTQEDYYSLHAVFSALDRIEKKYFSDPEQTARYRTLEAQITLLSSKKQTLERELEKAAGEPLVKLAARIEDEKKKTGGNLRPEYGYHSAIASNPLTPKWVQVDLGSNFPIDHILLFPCYDAYNGIGAGFGFPVRYRVEVCERPDFREGVVVLVDHSQKDVPNPAMQPQRIPAQGAFGRYVRVTALKLALRQQDYIFALGELQVFDTTGANVALQKSISALDSIEAPPRWRKQNLVDAVIPDNPTERIALLQAERQTLLEQSGTPPLRSDLASATHALKEAQAAFSQFPPPDKVYCAAVHHGSGNFQGTGSSGGKPRPIFLLARGQVTLPKAEMGPGALAILPFQNGRFALPSDASEGQRRAALARWITDPSNPLTWRSIVNRVWHYHFGRGLCDTPNDFGRNGALPSHPELLDWLSLQFRDQGGSLKALHRLIVTSQTYQQRSQPNAEAQRIDANNSLLWRQNRRKLEAEAVRDRVLVASGKLDLSMGGPGWQDFLIEHPAHSPHYQYHLANPEDPKTWRRSIYRFIVRSQTHPWMTSLDCADPSMRVDKRNESLSAAQALALLNNGFMLTQARFFAERVQRECADPSLAHRVRHAYRIALGSEPSPDALPKLVALTEEHGLPNLCRLLLNLNAFAFVD